jgi:hypothetical protein
MEIENTFIETAPAEAGISEESLLEGMRSAFNGDSAESVEDDRLPFPVDAFPDEIATMIQELNSCLGFPVDYVGISLLYAASIAIGNTVKVRIKAGWQESAILYCALVGPPGTGKTHPINFAMKPIRDLDKASYQSYETEKKEYERLIKLTKKERGEAGEPIKPVWRKFVLSDFTPESLAETHKFNKRGVAVCADELMSWINNFNRYNKGSEEQFWLSCWSAQPITIDRKTSEPIYIPSPFIPVIGGIQPGVLSDLGRGQRGRNGFMDRILFAFPKSIQKQLWSENELDPYHALRWSAIISELIGIKLRTDDNMNPNPIILEFSGEAHEIFVEWYNRNTTLIHDAGESEKAIYSKLESYLGRLSLIVELLDLACSGREGGAISANSVARAILLIEYFRETALDVQEMLGEKDMKDTLPANYQLALDRLPEVFKRSEWTKWTGGLDFDERKKSRFLGNKKLFNKLSHGLYQKIKK